MLNLRRTQSIDLKEEERITVPRSMNIERTLIWIGIYNSIFSFLN